MIAACGGAQEPQPKAVTLPPATASASAAPVATTTATASATATHEDDAGAADADEVLPSVFVAQNAMQAELRRCFNRALKNDPNLRAVVKLTIEVAPDGTVTKVTPHSTPPVPGDLEKCFAAAVSKTPFRAPGGNGATFELPINLVPANP